MFHISDYIVVCTIPNAFRFWLRSDESRFALRSWWFSLLPLVMYLIRSVVYRYYLWSVYSHLSNLKQNHTKNENEHDKSYTISSLFTSTLFIFQKENQMKCLILANMATTTRRVFFVVKFYLGFQYKQQNNKNISEKYI